MKPAIVIFKCKLAKVPATKIEIIYNESFGKMASEVLRPGAEFEVCGDYITSNKRAGGYPTSPDEAIIH